MANPQKAFADMLRVAISEAHSEGGTRLRVVADALVTKGMAGDVQAIREIADRLDGKVPQGVEGDLKTTVDLIVRYGGEKPVDP